MITVDILYHFISNRVLTPFVALTLIRCYFIKLPKTTHIILKPLNWHPSHRKLNLKTVLPNTQDISVEFFKSIFIFGALSTTSRVPSSSIIFKRRQTYLQQISPKLSSSHQNNWDGSTVQIRGKNMYFWFGGELSPLKQNTHLVIFNEKWNTGF